MEKEKEKIPSDFITALKQKWFVKQLGRNPTFGSDRVNVVGVNLDAVDESFCDCVKGKTTKGPNMDRTFWKCGEIDVMNLTNIKSSAEAKEEFEVVVTGQREFGKSMRPSGWFSGSFMGENYGRDSPSFNQQVHAIFVNQKESKQPSGIPDDTGSPVFLDTPGGHMDAWGHLKRTFFSKVVTERDRQIKTKAYNQGYQSGQHVGKRSGEYEGYQKGLEQGQKEQSYVVVENPVNSHNMRKLHESMSSFSECKKVLDEVLAAAEKCERDRKKSYDEGYAKGFSDGLNSD